MAGRVYLNIAYVAPRVALWVLLFLLGLVDGVRHRAVRSRGCVAGGGLLIASRIAELLPRCLRPPSPGSDPAPITA